MRKILITIFVFLLTIPIFAQTPGSLEVGTFNIRFFPCNADGEMMKKYDINMNHPPTGTATDTTQLFEMLKELNIEVLGVQEIVDPPLFGAMAKRHLGPQYQFIYAPTNGWQKVGILYDSTRVRLIGKAQVYPEISLGNVDRLRPALRAYFKAIPDGFDFHVVVVHLKASPRGWREREQQWELLSKMLRNIPREEEHHDGDIILLGDFNNVSKAGSGEFLPVLKERNFHWTGENGVNLYSNYWKPDWQKEEIQGSLIDQIFISDDANMEYVQGSLKIGGLCGQQQEKYSDELPSYYLNVSDHCPVFVTFEAAVDND